MAAGGSMSFPTLADEDIINFCREVVGLEEIPITLAALRNPTMESTMAIFSFFLKDMFGWNLDAALVVPFEASSRVEYFEVHRDQVPVMRFFNVMRQLLQLVHYASFNIEDILQPRPKRLRRQLSALSNFALHNQKMLEDYGDGVQMKIQSDIDDQQRLVGDNRTLKSQIMKHFERKEELELTIQNEQGAIEPLNQEIAQLVDQKERLEQEAKQSRADVARLEDQLSEAAVEDAKLNEERSRLEAQLVGSPEKVRQTLTRAQDELRSAEEQRGVASERRQDLRRMTAQSEQLAAGLERLPQRTEGVRELDQRVREVNGNITSVTDEMEANRQTSQQLRGASRQQLNRCQMIEESREGQMAKNKRYLKEKEDEMEKRQQQLGATRSRLAADRQEAVRLTAQQQQMTQQEQLDEQLFRREMDNLELKDQQIHEAVEWLKAECDAFQNELISRIDDV